MKNIISEDQAVVSNSTTASSQSSKWGMGERLFPKELENNSGGQKILEVNFKHYQIAARYVSGKRVLDIACGSGYGTQMLHLGGAISVVGVDVSPEAVQYAKEHYQTPSVEFICANAEEFEWQELFDVIISFETIEYLLQPDKFLERVRNLLVPGGDFLVGVPLGETRHFDPYHLHAFSQSDIFTLLKNAGFSVELYRLDPLFLTCSELLILGETHPETNPSTNQLLFTSRGWRIMYDFVFKGGFDIPQLLVVTRFS